MNEPALSSLTPADFKNHRVLKDGAFLVLALDRPDGTVVCKIAKEDNAKIRREIDRIAALKQRFSHLARWMPASLGEGLIEGGVLEGRLFSLQQFVPGPTLSQLLQKQVSHQDIAAIMGNVVTNLIDHIEDHRPIDSGQGWFDGMIRAAFTRILDLPLVGAVARLPEVTINGHVRKGLRFSVERIIDSPAFDRAIRKQPAIAGLGHWNFHGENIILNAAFSEGFAIIDPDVSLDECDPMFGLARLLYSFPHDSAERSEYLISSDLLMPRGGTIDGRFDVSFTWPEQVMENYRFLYRGVLDGKLPQVYTLDRRFASDSRLWYRLQISLLLCLLRGVGVNYKSAYPLNYGDMTHFQNEAVFLLLNAIELADMIVSDDD